MPTSAPLSTSLRAIALALCWALTVVRVEAQAETSAYDQALDRALVAHAAGDYVTAQSAMEEAHRLKPNARTFRGLGIVAYARGDYVEAAAALEAALRAEAMPLTPELRSGVEELLGRIWPQLARLSLHLDPPDSRVEVDGQAPTALGDSEIRRASNRRPRSRARSLRSQAQRGRRCA